jgi:serine/threonine-protein kinase RsbW
MTSDDARTVRLDIASRLDMLDMVQTVLSHLAGVVGFDEESVHYMTVALRESVVNAIRHGNRGDERRRVNIEFVVGDGSLEVRVLDEGAGFDPSAVPDPLAEANLLKPDGRGIFFMRSFMDAVDYSFPQGGGTMVRMVKRVPEDGSLRTS